MSRMDRFWAKVNKTDSCWLWTAGTMSGYGRFNLDGRVWRAHRLAYITIVGPIPDGLVLDHLCRNRACVNPAHLEPVDDATSIRRGIAGTVASNGASCRNGLHPWPDSAELGTDGWLRCGECHRARSARWRSKRALCPLCGSNVRRGDMARHRRRRHSTTEEEVA